MTSLASKLLASPRRPLPGTLPLVGALLLVLAGCRPAVDAVEPEPVDDAGQGSEAEVATEDELAREKLIADATRGVSDPALASLLADHWLSVVDNSPYYTGRGWGEYGPEGRARVRARRQEWLTRGRAIDAARLGEDDRINLELFLAGFERAEASEVCEYWAWSINPRDNPLETLNEAVSATAVADVAGAEALLTRLAAFPELLASTGTDLRDGLSRGLVADRRTLERTLEMFDRQLATPASDWALMIVLRERLGTWAPEQAQDATALQGRFEVSIDEELRPALAALTAILRDELLPAARGPEAVGVGALPLGADCYRAMIQLHTGDEVTADALHELGLAEIARIDGELIRLGQKHFGAKVIKGKDAAKLARVLEHLRGDQSLYFADADAVEAFARESLARANAELPKWFGRLPKAPCAVKRVPDYQAPYTYVGYYNQPSAADPSGYYFINTLAPETRPRFQARALAAHESVPGHHLQIAIALELEELPMVRRMSGDTVFVEGWALYAERLAAEMGLYQDDLDRLGALSYDAWRASRLVVDTGLHTKGWTVEEARAFMRAHTALAEVNIVNEVDRYVGWPGQALGYKYGQLEILKLRAEAEAALGQDFDIREFHDVVLGAGAVNLGVLRRRVTAWIEARAVGASG